MKDTSPEQLPSSIREHQKELEEMEARRRKQDEQERKEPKIHLEEVGKKYDNGKPMLALLPFNALIEIGKVMTFGASKYGKDNWKLVEPEKYEHALFRHLFAWMSGEDRDEETGLLHLAHAGCNILFLLYFKITKTGDTKCKKQ